jgi:hypothetical protein
MRFSTIDISILKLSTHQSKYIDLTHRIPFYRRKIGQSKFLAYLKVIFLNLPYSHTKCLKENRRKGGKREGGVDELKETKP